MEESQCFPQLASTEFHFRGGWIFLTFGVAESSFSFVVMMMGGSALER